MAETKTLDILSIKSGIIALPVNCAGTIPYGSLLWTLAYKYPHVQRQYYAATRENGMFGKAVLTKLTVKPELSLAMVFAQREYDTTKNAANKVDENAFKAAIQRVIKAYPNTDIYVPQTSGRAGDNWPEIAAAVNSLPVAIILPPETDKNSD